MKCNETQGKWCKNKHGASKIIDTFETYQEVKGREGRASGSDARFLEQVGCLGTPGLVAHLQIRKWQDSAHQVFDKMATRIWNSDL
jgi:hypothetical protein